MLFSQTKGGGGQPKGRKKICLPRAVVNMPDTPCSDVVVIESRIMCIYINTFTPKATAWLSNSGRCDVRVVSDSGCSDEVVSVL